MENIITYAKNYNYSIAIRLIVVAAVVSHRVKSVATNMPGLPCSYMDNVVHLSFDVRYVRMLSVQRLSFMRTALDFLCPSINSRAVR